jgi:hypothetical protein
MNSDTLNAWLHKLETTELLQLFKNLNVGDLVHNPWVLGAIGALALLALLMHWRVLLTTLLGTTGFVWLVDYTLKQEAAVDQLNSETLLVFSGGGIAIIMLVIYLLFIKSD